MKPSDLKKTWVVDLNVVEQPAFKKVIERVQKVGGYLMLPPVHLDELLKNPNGWERSLAKHFDALRPIIGHLVIGKQTSDILAIEFQQSRPHRKLLDRRATNEVRNWVRGTQSEEDVRRSFNEVMRTYSVARPKLHDSNLIADSLRRVAEICWGGTSKEEKTSLQHEAKSKLSPSRSPKFVRVVSEVGLEALCKTLEGHCPSTPSQTLFVQFVRGSLTFRLLCVEVLLHLYLRAVGKTNDPNIKPAKLANDQWDQFYVVYGSLCAGLETGDKAARWRHAILKACIPAAEKEAVQNWDKYYRLLTTPKGSASPAPGDT